MSLKGTGPKQIMRQVYTAGQGTMVYCLALTSHVNSSRGQEYVDPGFYIVFLVSGRDLACQQEVSLALTKTPPIHYYNVVDSTFNFYAG